MARLVMVRGRRRRRAFGAYLRPTAQTERVSRYRARRMEYEQAKARGGGGFLTPPVPPEDLSALGVKSFRLVCPRRMYGRGQEVVGIAYVMPYWAERRLDPDSKATQACIFSRTSGTFPCREFPSEESALAWLSEKAKEVPCS